jgi:Uma2 family endonuclease
MGALKIEDVAYTYDDYKMWEGDWELLDGVPIAMAPAPMINHQAIANMMAFELTKTVENCEKCIVASEVDYKISDNTILRPDVVLTCDEDNEAYLVKAPQIGVEIASKSTVNWADPAKFDIYEAEKVKYYIIVYPRDLVAKVYKLDNKKFDKQGDFTKESYEFEDTLCKVVVNFEKVFRRFRKK